MARRDGHASSLRGGVTRGKGMVISQKGSILYLPLGHSNGQFSVVQLGMDAVEHGIFRQLPGALDTASWPLHQEILHTSTFLILLDHEFNCHFNKKHEVVGITVHICNLRRRTAILFAK